MAGAAHLDPLNGRDDTLLLPKAAVVPARQPGPCLRRLGGGDKSGVAAAEGCEDRCRAEGVGRRRRREGPRLEGRLLVTDLRTFAPLPAGT